MTRYVVTVLHRFSARRAPTPEQLTAMGLSRLNPVAQVMVRQMLFLDAPAHTRVRSLAARAFTPRRVESLRARVQETVDELLDPVVRRGRMEVMADLAAPLPAIVTARMLGVPESDHESPTQHTARVAHDDVELGGRPIRKRQGVIAVLGAANRPSMPCAAASA